ncbi:unnamed protein product [Symbiodinium natans]|uniref:Uncharacterized protein n=1 Tax=Symbiodinium natans TaxID=878477 RepID=A0A812UMW4_9DINO|nr:unnamed protein product [Symbiodinium natans]
MQDISVEVLAGGPASLPSMGFEKAPKTILKHPLEPLITSASKACDHLKLLELGTQQPQLVFDGTCWSDVSVGNLLPPRVNELVHRLPVRSGLGTFLAAARQEFATSLKSPEVWSTLYLTTGTSPEENLRIQTGPGRDHDRCLFLASVLRLRSPEGANVPRFILDALLQLAKAMPPKNRKELADLFLRLSKEMSSKELIEAAGKALRDHAGHPLPQDVNAELQALQRHFITGLAQTWTLRDVLGRIFTVGVLLFLRSC